MKPANIMLANVDDPAERRIMLTDFGIARDINDLNGLTQTNMTVGTVAYCSPEQLLGGSIDAAPTSTPWPPPRTTCSPAPRCFPDQPGVVISSHLSAVPPSFGFAS